MSVCFLLNILLINYNISFSTLNIIWWFKFLLFYSYFDNHFAKYDFIWNKDTNNANFLFSIMKCTDIDIKYLRGIINIKRIFVGVGGVLCRWNMHFVYNIEGLEWNLNIIQILCCRGLFIYRNWMFKLYFQNGDELSEFLCLLISWDSKRCNFLHFRWRCNLGCVVVVR